MSLDPDTFLPDPASIKRALRVALNDSDRLDMAVAFVGKDWRDILGDFKGRTRLVCWLSSTNTDPRAVEKMTRQKRFSVRQVDAMHAKVYLPRGIQTVAIVGSANLSARALADEGASGQFEAAILVRRSSTVRQASEWFEALWQNHARSVTKHDLAAAKESWDAARAERAPSIGKPGLVGPASRGTEKSITRKKFLADLGGLPEGAMLAQVARSILASARAARLDIRWSERGFSLYSGEAPDAVGLLGVERQRRAKSVHVDVRLWMATKRNERVNKLVAELIGTASARRSPKGISLGLHLEQLSRIEKRLVMGLAGIARG